MASLTEQCTAKAARITALERYKIGLSPDGQIEIDKNTKYQEEKGQWTMEGAYLNYIA